jgi:biopolymer transport protein ExbD
MLADRWQAEELPHINMTPMVDVVLCLLVFFMVATRLYDWDDTQFEVKVPQVASAAPLTAAPDDLELTIEGPGKVSALGKTYDLAGLTDLLRQAKAGYADQAVQIRGDGTLPYQALADVLSCCDEAGIGPVRLRVRPRGENAPAE